MRNTLFLILFIWLGAGVVSYTVVELTGGGPQGEQGEQGERGPRGLAGEDALNGTLFENLPETPCSDAVAAYERGLATPGLSAQQVSGLYNIAATYCDW